MSAHLFSGLLALVIVSAFGLMYLWTIVQTLRNRANPPTNSPQYVYVATALAGLVGGVFAMVFNEHLPTETVATRATDDGSGSPMVQKRIVYGPTSALLALKNSVTPTPDNLLSYVTSAFVAVYLVVGLAAIATWVIASDKTPDLIKNLSLITIGLFIAIARSFFNLPN
jgi:hypothetical protein